MNKARKKSKKNKLKYNHCHKLNNSKDNCFILYLNK